jgi:hypothetical protein
VRAPANGIIDLCRRHLLWLIPISVCLLLIAPMALTDRTFAPDWSDHVWLVWQQKINLQDLGHPSYFIQNHELGSFYPFFAFYGTTLSTIAGTLALAVGSINSVIALYFCAFLAAYGGWIWLSAQAGLSGLARYLPGAIAVTAPYVLTSAYGIGDFPETVATSMIPLALASALSLMRAERITALPAAAFVFTVAILSGSHTLTVLWASTFLLAVVAVAALSGNVRVHGGTRRVLQLAGLAALGVGMSLWYLVPVISHGGDTVIGQRPTQIVPLTFGDLFRPLRNVPTSSSGTDENAQIPVLALLCAVIVVGLAWRGLSRQRRSLIIGLAALLGLVVLLCLEPSLIDHLPRPWHFLQFSRRLLTYADLIVVGLLVLGLAGLKARPSLLRGATVAVAVVAALGAIQALAQALAVPSSISQSDRTTPHTRDVLFQRGPDRTPLAWYGGGDFADASQPAAQPTLPQPLEVPVSESRQDSYELTYPPGPAGDVESNVSGGPYLVHVQGAEEVGVTQYQNMVLHLPASSEPRRVTVSARESAPLVAAQAISVLSLIGAVALVAWLALRGRLGTGGDHAAIGDPE